MNRLIILLIVLICYGNSLRAQEIEYSRPVNTPESCTSILVGKKASADGSVMTSHTCDGNYRTWMEIVPAARYERDTTVAIYNGRMHTEYPADRTNMELKGTIPEARSTYRTRSGISRCSARGRTRSGVYGRLSASRTIMWGCRPISRVSRRST